MHVAAAWPAVNPGGWLHLERDLGAPGGAEGRHLELTAPMLRTVHYTPSDRRASPPSPLPHACPRSAPPPTAVAARAAAPGPIPTPQRATERGVPAGAPAAAERERGAGASCAEATPPAALRGPHPGHPPYATGVGEEAGHLEGPPLPVDDGSRGAVPGAPGGAGYGGILYAIKQARGRRGRWRAALGGRGLRGLGAPTPPAARQQRAGGAAAECSVGRGRCPCGLCRAWCVHPGEAPGHPPRVAPQPARC
jgi:hypothetical protein